MRYNQHILFEKIGQQGQEKIVKANIMILGLGATGTNSAELLTRAGIGSLTLIDRDIVELSNLQRQTLFIEEDLNKSKSLIALKHLKKINSQREKTENKFNKFWEIYPNKKSEFGISGMPID